MRRSIFFYISAAALALPAASEAAVVLDQSTFAPMGGNDNGLVVHSQISIPSGLIPIRQATLQTITAGLDGTLAAIELKLAYLSGSTKLNFYLFDEGWTEGKGSYSYINPVFETALTITNPAYTIVRIDLSAADFAVSAGKVFSFSLRPDWDTISWIGYASNPVKYAGGSNYIGSNSGLPFTFASYRHTAQFQTFVDVPDRGTGSVGSSPVPEPATWAMMILGLAAAGGTMRRRVAVVRLA